MEKSVEFKIKKAKVITSNSIQELEKKIQKHKHKGIVIYSAVLIKKSIT
ncbi:hypothetical protein ACQ1Q1_05780 [Ornithobacterium rhinotracheale]